jgi:hypothetical protein
MITNIFGAVNVMEDQHLNNLIIKTNLPNYYINHK